MWVFPQLLKFTIYFVRSGGQCCVFSSATKQYTQNKTTFITQTTKTKSYALIILQAYAI